jgi:hypothetical protein
MDDHTGLSRGAGGRKMDLHAAADVIIAFCALASLIVGLLNRRQIHEVHLSMNSRLDAFLKLTGDAAHAQGFKEGRELDK